MPSADQVPVKSSHSTMLWPMWVVLIAGHVGPALGVARRRGTWRGDTVCAEDDGLPSEVAASIVSEAGAAGKLRRISTLCAQAGEFVRAFSS